MVFHGDNIDPAEEEEMIYIRDQKKAEDDEMQILTPIMLDSMFDLKSPPDLFRILKDSDKLDDATAVTTDSFSDILLPTLNTPPRIMNVATVDDDVASEISFDSYGRGEVPTSPRNVISAGFASSYPLLIPADIRYEGEVTFSTSSISRSIHLQPRPSARTESIFVPKAFPRAFPIYSDYALADSVSSFGDYGGAEECKDDQETSSDDEGFAYVHAGERCNEEDYWGIYDGHYGSRDFMDDDKNNVDYALDHASVQSEPPLLSPQYQDFNRQPKTSILEELTDIFAACFSCSEGDRSSQANKRSFASRNHQGGAFGPGDYGVSPMCTRTTSSMAKTHLNYRDLAAERQSRIY